APRPTCGILIVPADRAAALSQGTLVAFGPNQAVIPGGCDPGLEPATGIRRAHLLGNNVRSRGRAVVQERLRNGYCVFKRSLWNLEAEWRPLLPSVVCCH